MTLQRLFQLSSAFVLAGSLSAAHADTIAWTTWSTVVAGNPGVGTGTIDGSTTVVTYTGQTSGRLTNYPSWGPVSTFTGGLVGNAPPASDNSIQIEGGSPLLETITFSTPIVDPLLAIWSLGAGGSPAEFDFNSSEPFAFETGGPSNEYGGTALVKIGNNVFGAEGNGVVEFFGTYSSLTFTTPVFENYYAFTLGQDTNAPANPAGVTPEPSSLSLLGLGMTAIPFARREIKRRLCR